MNAIVQNKHIFKDKVVLDVGCGTAILSMCVIPLERPNRRATLLLFMKLAAETLRRPYSWIY